MKANHDTCRVTWSPEEDEHVGTCVEFQLIWDVLNKSLRSD